MCRHIFKGRRELGMVLSCGHIVKVQGIQKCPSCVDLSSKVEGTYRQRSKGSRDGLYKWTYPQKPKGSRDGPYLWTYRQRSKGSRDGP